MSTPGAMDFFGSQDRARKKTTVLVGYMVLALLTIIAALYVIAILAIPPEQAASAANAQSQGLQLRWDPAIFLGVCAATLLVVGGGSLYKILALRSGGKVVAEALGGRVIEPGTTDPQERRLMNVVEEIAIASGMGVPPVYVMDTEAGINAFAAGWSSRDAVVAVTQGTLQNLNREELQGVVGHEFSHIHNGDMRLNIRLMGILHGLLLVAIVGQIAMRAGFFSGGGRRKDNGGAAIGLMGVGVALLALGYIGVFFGSLIKAAVSRQREYLADAAAVQFTRNPQGISGALKKIGGLSEGSRVQAPHASEVSHMFFGDAVKNRMVSAFSTHPPLIERIRRIDPEFKGAFETTTANMDDVHPRDTVQPAGAAGFAGAPPSGGAPVSGRMSSGPWSAPDSRQALHPDHALSGIGAPSDNHIDHAQTLLDAIPAGVRDLLRNPLGARAVVYVLLMSDDPGTQQTQWERLNGKDPEGAEESERVARHVRDLPRELRLPLVELSLTGLRLLTAQGYAAFRYGVYELIVADKHMELFEFAAQRLILAHLAPSFERPDEKRVRYQSVRVVRRDAAVLLSALAHAGGSNAAAKEVAFSAGMRDLDADSPLIGQESCAIPDVEKALDRLELASGAVKRQIVTGCTAVVASDGFVNLDESELLRAIADSLGCPMPPLLPNS